MIVPWTCKECGAQNQADWLAEAYLKCTRCQATFFWDRIFSDTQLVDLHEAGREAEDRQWAFGEVSSHFIIGDTCPNGHGTCLSPRCWLQPQEEETP